MKLLICPVLILFACTFTACQKFEFSPHEEEVYHMPSYLNDQNIRLLMEREPGGDDTVTIIYTGDSQRHYDRLEDMVDKVNNLHNVDFFVLCGDLSDFGIAQEYIWINDRLKNLHVPYICAIGNHDMANDNGTLFTKMFGAKNFSFTYKKYKFIFHDTNSRENNFNGQVPSIPWLTAQITDPAPNWFVGVSHVPPYDEDFDNNLEGPYHNLFASDPRFILSLHGHKHDASDYIYYDDGVRYMTSNSVEKPEMVLLKFYHGQIIKQMIAF